MIAAVTVGCAALVTVLLLDWPAILLPAGAAVEALAVLNRRQVASLFNKWLWLGLALAVVLPIFPVGGWGRLEQMILPALALSLPFTAYIARLMRAGMLDVLGSDYIRTARAKGLAEREVVYKHAFKPAFLPVLSFLGPAAASILTGSFVIEQLFAIPGIGRHFVLSVLHRDQPLIIGTVLLYAVLLVTFNLVVDVAYLFVDPRISREEAI